MATVKVKLRLSSNGNMEGRIFYQIIHKRIARQIKSEILLRKDEWDSVNSVIRSSIAPDKERKAYLETAVKSIADGKKELLMIIGNYESSGTAYTSDDIIQRYISRTSENNLISFAEDTIRQLHKIGKENTAERYEIVIKSFRRFMDSDDIKLEDITQSLMISYESYMKSKGLCPNTTSFYMRGLRAIYYRAVEKSYIPFSSPFKYVYTGIGKTTKRAVSIDIIRKIKKINLEECPKLDFARDIFLFSFYTRGMSFIDIAYLKKKDLSNGILKYSRKKTGQTLTIKWEKEMQEIVYKHNTCDSEYMLPIITNQAELRKSYKSAAHAVNVNLKKVGYTLGLEIPLTTYVARHSWASIAKSKNISIATISDAMGHDSEKTTRIYLATLDTSAVDKANSLILKGL